MRTGMNPASRLAFLAYLATSARSYSVSKHQECVASLVGVYGDLTFVGVGYGVYYDTVCANPLAVTSLHASAKIYCSTRDYEDGFQLLKEACAEYSTNGTLLPESAVASNLTDDAIHNMKYIQLSELTAETNLTEPVVVSEEVFRLTYRTEDDWDNSLLLRRNYGYAIYGFWGGLLLIGMIQRLATWLFQSRRPPTSSDTEKNNGRHRGESKIIQLLTTPYRWIRTHVITPSALRPYRRELLFGCTVPTRLEFLIVFACWAVNIALCAVNIRGFTGNFYWPKVSTQAWRYISDRTGVISYANLPVIWMFSGRNNIFIWATGWKFSTFNTYHKHVARIATLQAIIHSIGYTVFYRSYAGNWSTYLEEYEEQWFYLGVAATVVMSFLILLSFSIFRGKLYETFLLVHIILAVLLIVFLYRHTSIFDGEYDPYLWTPVAIWCFDRFLRFVRLAYCNIHVYMHTGTSIHHTTASVSFNVEANRLSIDVIPATSSLKPGPGQHYYLYQPLRLTGWENHPLTLAAWEFGDSHQPSSQQTDSGNGTQLTSSRRLTLTFWLRPRDGWTRQLVNDCMQSPSKKTAVTILLEGPYGEAEPLWEFDEVLLIAGGSGISAVLPYLRDHMDRSEDPKRVNRTTAITLLWVDRSESYIRQHAATVLAEALSRQDVTSAFYSTSTIESHSDVSQLSQNADQVYKTTEGIISKNIDSIARSEPPTPEQIIVNHGRPDITTIIGKAATTARQSSIRLAIYVCGPPGLADATRDAAYKAMRKDSKSVEYFEEAFSW